MASLVSLPDEVLLQIISYFLEPGPNLQTLPFDRWTEWIDDHINPNSPWCSSRFPASLSPIQSLLLVHPRLYHSSLLPLHYSKISFSSTYQGQSDLFCLLRSIHENPILGEWIREIHITGTQNIRTRDYEPIFFLPGIKTVNITGYADWSINEPVKSERKGKSPVEVLRLIEFAADERGLIEILSWMRGLRELWYEVDRAAFEDSMFDDDEEDEEEGGEGSDEERSQNGFSEGGLGSSFIDDDDESGAIQPQGLEIQRIPNKLDLDGIVRAMNPQKESLETFVFTKTGTGTTDGYQEDPINLSSFPQLRTLKLDHVFLVGCERPNSIPANLPPSLELLEVEYSNYRKVAFINDIPFGNRVSNSWLFGPGGICSAKKSGKYLPNLKGVRIISREGQRTLAHTAKRWLGGREKELEDVGISYDFVLHDEYCRITKEVEGDVVWEKEWFESEPSFEEWG